MVDLTANWHWPQWTLLILLVLSLIINTGNHGKPREPYNGFTSLISFGMWMFFLVCGGFFS